MSERTHHLSPLYVSKRIRWSRNKTLIMQNSKEKIRACKSEALVKTIRRVFGGNYYSNKEVM